MSLTASDNITDDDGEVVGVELRLNVNCRAPKPWMGWSVTLKLHRMRIDGVDHEAIFDTADGTKGTGWHRHLWDSTERNGDRLKQPLASFGEGPPLSRVDFVVRAFSELRVLLNNKDDGNANLPLS